MALIATYSQAVAKLSLLDLTGSQIEMTINQFAEFLSRHEIWSFCKRDYHTAATEMFGPYAGVTVRPKMTKMAKYLHTLVDINENFEYALGVGYPRDDEEWINITFSKSGTDVMVEFH